MALDISQYKLSFLGTGHMASAIINALLIKKTIKPTQIIATHYKQNKLEEIRSKFPSISVIASNIEATKLGNIIFLCVRPQQIKALLEEIKPYCTGEKIIVSIAAGIRLATLRQLLANTQKIFHLHPSSLIFQLNKKYCVSFLTAIPQYQQEMKLIINIFSPITEVLIVEESELNKLIVMVGCVPGYLALLWKYLFEIAEQLGIEHKMAFELEKKVMIGIQHSIFEAAYDPGHIIEMIATSGGVTIAGLKSLEKNDTLKRVLQTAVNASLKKLEEISKGEL